MVYDPKQQLQFEYTVNIIRITGKMFDRSKIKIIYKQ